MDDKLDKVATVFSGMTSCAELLDRIRKLKDMGIGPRGEFELVLFLHRSFPKAGLMLCRDIASCVDVETLTVVDERQIDAWVASLSATQA